jgi:hypothetical protein
MPIYLPPFDPTRSFVAKTNFRAGGVIWLRDQAFDNSAVNVRVLGQLYDQRKIAYAADGAAAGQPKSEPQPKNKGPKRLGALLNSFLASVTRARDMTAGEEQIAASPPEAEAAAAPVGETATAAADRTVKIEKAMTDHSQAQLLEKAEGIPGLSKRTPKADIAAAIVDAGRA